MPISSPLADQRHRRARRPRPGARRAPASRARASRPRPRRPRSGGTRPAGRSARSRPAGDSSPAPAAAAPGRCAASATGSPAVTRARSADHSIISPPLYGPTVRESLRSSRAARTRPVRLHRLVHDALRSAAQRLELDLSRSRAAERLAACAARRSGAGRSADRRTAAPRRAPAEERRDHQGRHGDRQVDPPRTAKHPGREDEPDVRRPRGRGERAVRRASARSPVDVVEAVAEDRDRPPPRGDRQPEQQAREAEPVVGPEPAVGRGRRRLDQDSSAAAAVTHLSCCRSTPCERRKRITSEAVAASIAPSISANPSTTDRRLRRSSSRPAGCRAGSRVG